MNKKIRKAAAAAGCAVLLAGGGTFAVKKFGGSRTVTVESVGNLNVGWYEDPFTTYGSVYDSENLAIYVSENETVNAVFVSEGQEVKAGDKLMEYDISSLEFSLEIKKMQLETTYNKIAQAQYELKKLKAEKPVSNNIIPTPVPTPEPTPVPTPVPTAEPVKSEKIMTGDAWNYIDCIDDRYAQKTEPSAEPEETEDPQETDDPEVTAVPEETSEPEETADPQETSVPEETAAPEETAVPEETASPEEIKDGSREHPYRFIVTQDGLVYGSLFNELAQEEAYAVIEIREENKADGELISQWYINAKYLADYEDDTAWYVLTHQPSEEEEIPEETAEPETEPVEEENTVIDFEEGYTAEELASLITQKERELKSLDLQRRRQIIEISSAEEAVDDGIVYAKHDGIVTAAHAPGDIPDDGSAFLSVSGGSGVYVEGTVSELMLDEVQVGQTVYAMSWSTGGSYTGYVSSIDSYPAANERSYGSGNPNVSYYSFEACFPDTDGLNTGDYLEMNFEKTGYAYVSDDIWLYIAYLRKDSSGYYVMKDDGNGYLTKQSVQVGKIEYGEYCQILGGIDESDFIAFPYGKNAVEGAKTEGAEYSEEIYDDAEFYETEDEIYEFSDDGEETDEIPDEMPAEEEVE